MYMNIRSKNASTVIMLNFDKDCRKLSNPLNGKLRNLTIATVRSLWAVFTCLSYFVSKMTMIWVNLSKLEQPLTYFMRRKLFIIFIRTCFHGNQSKI